MCVDYRVYDMVTMKDEINQLFDILLWLNISTHIYIVWG